MRRILISLVTIAAVGGLAVGATRAFFNDTETSVGNTIRAGKLDLKIDSQAHYDGLVCVKNDDGDPPYWWQEDPNNDQYDPVREVARTELVGQPCVGTWDLRNLGGGASSRFFNLADAKPGDWGENTISLHVFDNDAWGRMRLSNVAGKENGCTEPERADDVTCGTDDTGELAQALQFGNFWLDQGEMPGFQCQIGENGQPVEGANNNCSDPGEGDNIWQRNWEPAVSINQTPIKVGEEDTQMTYNLSEALSSAFQNYCDGESPDGHDQYGPCQGLAEDGRLVGSTTYYFGVDWNINPQAGNEIQTDSLSADISFDVVQHRNNPNGDFLP